MKPSSLQMLHSHFLGLSLIALDTNPADLPAGDSPYPPLAAEALKVDITLGEFASAEQKNEYMVTLGISNETPATPNNFPYRFAARMEGFFHLDDDTPAEDRKRLVVINGSAMLFGAMREQLLSLSLRHRNGPLLLPSLDFRVLRPKPAATATVKTEKTKARRSRAKAA